MVKTRRHHSKRHSTRKARRHTRRHRGGAVGLMGVIKEALVPFGLVALNNAQKRSPSKSRKSRRNGRRSRRR